MKNVAPFLFFSVFFSVFTLFLPPLAQAADPVHTAGALQKKYDTIQSFTAKFKQDLKNSASGEVETRTGTIAFKKPLLVRWETVEPEKELLLVGKNEVWDYFSDDKEAYRYPVEEIINSKTMLRFLTGKSNILEDFHVTASKEPAESGATVLDLAPKDPEPGLVGAVIWIDAASGLISRVRIQDFYANTNDLSLSEIVADPKLTEGAFQFTPPSGVKIHDNVGGIGAPAGRTLGQ